MAQPDRSEQLLGAEQLVRDLRLGPSAVRLVAPFHGGSTNPHYRPDPVPFVRAAGGGVWV